MKRIINCETGEIIDREYNDEELAQKAIDEANEKKAQAEKLAAFAAAEAKKAAILEKLGISEDEAKILLS